MLTNAIFSISPGSIRAAPHEPLGPFQVPPRAEVGSAFPLLLVSRPINLRTSFAIGIVHRTALTADHERGKPAKSVLGKARTTARLNTWRGFATPHGADSRLVFGRELVGRDTRSLSG